MAQRVVAPAYRGGGKEGLGRISREAYTDVRTQKVGGPGSSRAGLAVIRRRGGTTEVRQTREV